MVVVKLTQWEVDDEHQEPELDIEEGMVSYLEACLEAGDAAMVMAALGSIAREQGMSRVARASGVSREHLYKALSVEGNPEFSTVMRVFKALGFKLYVERI